MELLDIDAMVCEINDRPDSDECPQNIIEQTPDGRYFYNLSVLLAGVTI